MKDVPAHLPAGLALGAFLAAADPRDAFVSARFASLDELPEGAHVGTASLRRRAQLGALRRDLKVSDLRGNVGTRLRKLDEGGFDAILLACAGLDRLGLGSRISSRLDADQFVPAVGQGVIGIECREDDSLTRERIASLHSVETATRLAAERAFNARLGGACHVPVAGHAHMRESQLRVIGLVGSPDGSRIIRDEMVGEAGAPEELGLGLAESLLRKGAAKILKELGVDV